MYITVYQPGTDSLAGDFRATFQVQAGGTPPVITGDMSATIAGESVTLHPSTYDAATGLFVLPFSLLSGALDGTETSIGLLTLMGVTSQQMKLLSVEIDFPIPDILWIGLVLLVIIYLLLKR